jgi:hypothetical protein
MRIRGFAAGAVLASVAACHHSAPDDPTRVPPVTSAKLVERNAVGDADLRVMIAELASSKACELLPDVLSPALRDGASAIVLVHNHPSGDPTPGPEDIAMTRAVRAAGDLLGIPDRPRGRVAERCVLTQHG